MAASDEALLDACSRAVIHGVEAVGVAVVNIAVGARRGHGPGHGSRADPPGFLPSVEMTGMGAQGG